ncbi:MAG: acyloxyacyl hydrolase [Brachymonas sp.]
MSLPSVFSPRPSVVSRLVVSAVLIAGSGCALAADWSVGVGSGDKGVRKISLAAGWDREEPLWQGQKWHLALRHEVELGIWRIRHASDAVEFGYSPVLRLIRPLSTHAGRLFVEGSIGVRLISNKRLSPDFGMSTAFQFSDMLGIGYQWGTEQRTTVGVRATHVSNGGIKKPNHGVNFGQLYVQRTF